MFDIEIRRSFSAAHQLRGYDGACQNLHGHNYGVVVTVRTGKLDEIGISLDFKKLKAAVDEIIERFDHHNISELPEFAQSNASSEMLAVTIYRKLAEKINDDSRKVRSVRVEESAGSACTYFEEE